jgi:hypothetical protein
VDLGRVHFEPKFQDSGSTPGVVLSRLLSKIDAPLTSMARYAEWTDNNANYYQHYPTKEVQDSNPKLEVV